MPNTTIQLKKSFVAGVVPSGLANGELALNIADGNLWFRLANNAYRIINPKFDDFATVNAAGTLIVADTPGDVLNFVAGSNMTITGFAGNDTILFASSGSAGGAAVAVSELPPPAPTANSLWWNANTGELSIYYSDSNSSQWVVAIGSQGPAGISAPTSAYDRANSSVLRAGDTMTGKINLFNTSATAAGLNLGAGGTSPSSPVHGDVWISTGSNFQIYLSGTTYFTSFINKAETFTAKKTFNPSTTSTAFLNLQEGDDPSAPSNGDIWLKTDGWLKYRWNGTTYLLSIEGHTHADIWAQANAAHSKANTAIINYVIDGGGSVISIGQKGHMKIPFNCTLTNWEILLDQSGSIAIQIWKDSYANFPPTVADDINATSYSVTTAVKNQGTQFTVSNTINANDIIAYNVVSATTATRATVALTVVKT